MLEKEKIVSAGCATKCRETVIREFVYKIQRKSVTLYDQDEALKDPYTAFLFAKHIKGADIEKCQEAACKHPYSAYRFAKDIKGADIEKCQEGACKDLFYVYCFAKYVEGADIEKCQEATYKDPEWAYYFAIYIEVVDIDKSLEACKGTKYEVLLNEYLMRKTLM